MYFTIANRTFWDDYAALSDLLSEELRLWGTIYLPFTAIALEENSHLIM